MKLWLSMIIKNEANKIRQCIWDIVDLFDDVVILDTGSTDETITILESLGVKPIHYEINHKDKNRLIDARNYSIEQNKCDRVLIMDGDECISREDIIKLKQHEPKEDVSGFFIKWVDHRYGEEFDDYKMCLINKSKVRFLFSVHACPQVYVRDNGWTWLWLNGITLHHYPEQKNYREKYIDQIKDWISENPGCLRFYWFLWYSCYRNDQIQEAKEYFDFIITHMGVRFPVETLNSIMVLASICQQEWDSLSAYYYVDLWLEYYQTVQHDFEIKVNFRLYDRFLQAHKDLLNNPDAPLVPYSFAF